MEIHEEAERELLAAFGDEYALVKRHAAESEEFADLLSRFHNIVAKIEELKAKAGLNALETERQKLLDQISDYVIDKEEDREDERAI